MHQSSKMSFKKPEQCERTEMDAFGLCNHVNQCEWTKTHVFPSDFFKRENVNR